jgi:hypothetical protein
MRDRLFTLAVLLAEMIVLLGLIWAVAHWRSRMAARDEQQLVDGLAKVLLHPTALQPTLGQQDTQDLLLLTAYTLGRAQPGSELAEAAARLRELATVKTMNLGRK